MKVLLGALIIIILGGMILGYIDLSQKINNTGTAVINMEDLYLSFELTKELEKKYKKLSKDRNIAIDSLDKIIKTLQYNKIMPQDKIVQKLQVTSYNRATLQQQNENTKLELEQQIWNQLNQYLNEFGQQQTNSIILGAQGNGNIIYAGELVDVTTEAIKFVNNKYQGLN